MLRYFLLLSVQLFVATVACAQITVTQQGGAQNCVAPCKSMAVIFLHGLTGSDATWVNQGTGASFPNLLYQDDDQQLKGKLDIYNVQYDSLWSSGKPIVEVTKAVSAELDKVLKKKKYTKVAFVAHSLGGNIAREYLVHVKARYGHAAMSRFRMLISLGTPTEGASLANFASLFSGNEQIRSLIEIRKNDFLQLMRTTEIDYLEKRLNNRCARIEFDAAYETKPVGLLVIVSKDSAVANATRSAGNGWEKNHLELPKPADRSDKVYEWVRDELKLCAAGQSRCADAVNPTPVCATGDF